MSRRGVSIQTVLNPRGIPAYAACDPACTSSAIVSVVAVVRSSPPIRGPVRPWTSHVSVKCSIAML
jgi:hypothetical protein